MKAINKETLLHLAAQVGIQLALAGAVALGKVDYSSLGAYAPLAVSFVAMATTVANQYLRPAA